MGGEDAAEPVGLLDLSDDNLADLLRATSWNRNACKLALVLTCRRFRQVQLEAKMALRTSLRSVACSMTMLNWAVDAGCPYPVLSTCPSPLARGRFNGRQQIT